MKKNTGQGVAVPEVEDGELGEARDLLRDGARQRIAGEEDRVDPAPGAVAADAEASGAVVRAGRAAGRLRLAPPREGIG